MALPLTLALVAGLAGITFVCRGLGPALARIPPVLSRRTAGLAPALLAGLVVLQLTTPRGVPTLDARALAVVTAIVLSALRVPFVVVVAAGALAAALARAYVHG